MDFPKTEKELELYFALKDLEKARERYLNPPSSFPKSWEHESMLRYDKEIEEYLKLVNE